MDQQMFETALHYFLGAILGATGMVCTTWMIVSALKRRTLRQAQYDLSDRLGRMEATMDWFAARMADAELREPTHQPMLRDATRTPQSYSTPHS